MKSVISMTLLFFLLIGCNKKENSYIPQNLTSVWIGKGDIYGNGDENIPQQNIIITNQEDWNNLMNSMNSVNNVSNSFTETNINFEVYQIIAVFDEIKNSGGYSIDITSVVENEDNIVVFVDKLLNGSVNDVITQPFHIIKIQKSNKLIYFNILD